MARIEELSIDRQGRLEVPRSMRHSLGSVPGTIRIREIDGGLLLEPLPAGRDDWWRQLHDELESFTDSQISSLADETAQLSGTAGDGLS